MKRTEGFDWLEVQLDRPLPVVREWLKKFSGEDLSVAGSHRFYKTRLEGSYGLTVLCHPRMEKLMECQVRIPGAWFMAKGRIGQEFGLLLVEQGRPFRIDWAIDLQNEYLMDVDGFEVESHFGSLHYEHRRGKENSNHFHGQWYTGFTNGKSEFRLKAYDKGFEQGLEDYDVKKWWRLEVCVRGDLCKQQEWTDERGEARFLRIRSLIIGLLVRRYRVPDWVIEGISLRHTDDARAKKRSEGNLEKKLQYWQRRGKKAKVMVQKLKRELFHESKHDTERLLEEFQKRRQSVLEFRYAREERILHGRRKTCAGSIRGSTDSGKSRNWNFSGW